MALVALGGVLLCMGLALHALFTSGSPMDHHVDLDSCLRCGAGRPAGLDPLEPYLCNDCEEKP